MTPEVRAAIYGCFITSQVSFQCVVHQLQVGGGGGVMTFRAC